MDKIEIPWAEITIGAAGQMIGGSCTMVIGALLERTPFTAIGILMVVVIGCLLLNRLNYYSKKVKDNKAHMFLGVFIGVIIITAAINRQH